MSIDLKSSICIKEIEESLKNKLDEIEEWFNKGKIGKYLYSELKLIETEQKDFENNIDAFKNSFAQKKPLSCSKLLYEIYKEHTSGFRKAILMSNAIPDPLGFKYNSDTHDLIKEIMSIAYNTGSLLIELL